MVENCDIMLEILRKHNPFERIRDSDNCDDRLIFLGSFFTCPRNHYNDYKKSLIPKLLFVIKSLPKIITFYYKVVPVTKDNPFCCHMVVSRRGAVSYWGAKSTQNTIW